MDRHIQEDTQYSFVVLPYCMFHQDTLSPYSLWCLDIYILEGTMYMMFVIQLNMCLADM